MNRMTIATNLYGVWLRGERAMLTGYEHTDPAHLRVLLDDAQYNNEIDPREIAEIVPLVIEFFGQGKPAYLVPAASSGEVETVCPACWPRHCDCADTRGVNPPCPICKTADDVGPDNTSEADETDYVCTACGEEFTAPRATRHQQDRVEGKRAEAERKLAQALAEEQQRNRSAKGGTR